MASSEKKSKTNWGRVFSFGNIVFAMGLIATGVLVCGLYWLYTGDGKIPATIDMLSLNLVGDTLSGFAASLALIWLIVGVIIQRSELRVTQETLDSTSREAKKQTDLNYRTADANYQLAMFDRRKDIYNRILSFVGGLAIEGDVTAQMRSTFFSAQNDARFFYPDTINVAVGEFEKHIVEYARHKNRMRVYDEKIDRGVRIKEEDETKNTKSIDIAHREEQWLFDNMTVEELDKLFMPHLKLPDRIEAPKD